MSQPVSLPFYAKLAAVLVSIALILTFVYLGQDIFIPLALALMFAILLRPVVSVFQHKLRFPLVLSVSVAVVLALVVLAGVIYFISLQIGDMASDWEKIKANLTLHFNHLTQWINDSFGITFKEQQKYLQKATQDSVEGGKEMLGSTLNSFTGTLMNLVLIPFYTFLILLYRNLFIVFFLKLFPNEPQRKIHRILLQIKASVQSFLVGTMIEMGIVATLTSIGLMIIGMKYAILLGVITGILNLIPYIGILVAALVTIVATLTSSAELSTIVGVVVVNIIVQIIDNNVLVPMIVSSKVKMNAFISVIIIVIGGELAGVAGMFLAIPFTAILKIIFDEIESLEPWGYLIGDDVPTHTEWKKSDMPTLADAEAAKLENKKAGGESGFLQKLFPFLKK